MKKSVLFLLGVILSLNFISCKDDDDKDVYVYSDEYLELKVNGETIKSKYIVLEMYSGTEGVAILCSIIPDAYQQGIYVTLTENQETKKIEGKLVHTFYEVELSGTIQGDILTADVTYKNTSGLVGEWDYADTYVRIEAKNGISIEDGTVIPADIMEQQLKGIFSRYISRLITLDLTCGGYINATYLSLQNNVNTLTHVSQYYTTKERVFFIPDLSFLITGKAESKANLISYDTVYLDYKLENDQLTFYIDKDALLVLRPVIRILNSIFEETPEVIGTIESILGIASQAEVFEVGITLKR